MPTMKTFTICRQHPKAHKAVFCVCWNKEHYSSIQFEGETEALQLSRFTAEMNEQRSVPASPDTFSLFIQIAIKINHFCVFPFLCFWWTSSFFLSFSLPFFAISIVPFYSYALRLCESFTFNVYFCWKKRRKKLFFFCWFMFSWKVWFLFPSGALQKHQRMENVENFCFFRFALVFTRERERGKNT